MAKLSLSEARQLLDRVNWNFEDYTSSSYPLDINSMHWYPASFVPHIPSILVQIFSEPGQMVFDPFIGNGVTLIEAAKQDRSFMGIDLNPYAVDIASAKFKAINCRNWDWLVDFQKEISTRHLQESTLKYCSRHGIKKEATKWFHSKTLQELLAIYDCIVEHKEEDFLLKKVAFSSILKSCSSQKKHYTYITDGCFPEKLIRVEAKEKYCERLQWIEAAASRFREEYKRLNSKSWSKQTGRIEVGDARQIDRVDDRSTHLIITSPPYLACNDYIKSMRLSDIFFPIAEKRELLKKEIGARFKRGRKAIQEEYIGDMKKALCECKRILKENSYLALVFGQGKGRARKFNLVEFFFRYLTGELGFTSIFDTPRDIKFHRVRFPGVKKEHIMVFGKGTCSSLSH